VPTAVTESICSSHITSSANFTSLVLEPESLQNGDWRCGQGARRRQERVLSEFAFFKVSRGFTSLRGTRWHVKRDKCAKLCESLTGLLILNATPPFVCTHKNTLVSFAA
jgi:hypothetical protein